MRLNLGELEIVLPNAQLGNTVTKDYNTIVNISRQGTVNQSMPPNRAVLGTRHYKIATATNTEKEAMRDFIMASIGQTIGVVDHVTSYTGILRPESFEITCRKDGCSYDFEFDILIKDAYTLDTISTEDGEVMVTQDSENIIVEIST